MCGSCPTPLADKYTLSDVMRKTSYLLREGEAGMCGNDRAAQAAHKP